MSEQVKRVCANTLTGLIDLAHEHRHALVNQSFPDNDEGDAFSRVRDSRVARIDRIIEAARAAPVIDYAALHAEAEALRAENAKLRAALAEQGERQDANQDMRALAASLYQACGAYDMPTRVLDVLSAAANGEPFAHMIDGLLPCVPPSEQEVRALVEALENGAAALAWNCFRECRAVHAGPIMPAAKALDTARAALATHRQAQARSQNNGHHHNQE